MNQFIESLIKNAPIILDGAWGTRLQQLGLAPGECPDIWNLQHPEKVELVAKEYVAAGSQIILTNTFRSNRIALQIHDLAEKTTELNLRGVEISKCAAQENCLVFASIGPSGKMLLSGEVTEQQLAETFSEQAGLLNEAGADAIIIETMSDLEEAKIALRAAKEMDLPVGVSMVFDAGKEKDHTMMGNPPEQVAEELTLSGADFIGANCGQGIDGFLSICKRMKEATNLPLWMKANAGLPEIVDGETTYRTTAKEYVAYVKPLVTNGAVFIGGCCGTSPAFIEAIHEELAGNY
jgi:methionine synthase I (cobalamin-dependent)